MKYTINILFIILLFGCVNQHFNREISHFESISTKEILDNKELSVHYYEGFHTGVKLLLPEISEGVYARNYVPGLINEPELKGNIKDYVYEKGRIDAYNILSEEIINGFIAHQKRK